MLGTQVHYISIFLLSHDRQLIYTAAKHGFANGIIKSIVMFKQDPVTAILQWYKALRGKQLIKYSRSYVAIWF